ncbi:MAG TPA: hypothetical protein VD864_04635 [Nocardioides sp.]|nr:hypothetical protein [Nocardioides sp.]
MRSSTVPDGLPFLSRGRHRTPRRGASPMEAASLLAGEPWSDRPACTHPLLAQLADLVSDHTSDAGRQQLIAYVPSLIGRQGDDETWLRLPVALAASAILDVPETTQRILAAGLLRAERLCAEAGRGLEDSRRAARDALDLVPGAAAWAGRLRTREPLDETTFAQTSAPRIVRCTVEGVVASDGPDLDRRLRALLEVGMAACPSGAS